MNPRIVQKLLENIPEVRELVAFLAAEANKLNTLDGINEPAEPTTLAVEVLARLRAKQTIDAMLAPLLVSVDKPTGTDPSEFVV